MRPATKQVIALTLLLCVVPPLFALRGATDPSLSRLLPWISPSLGECAVWIFVLSALVFCPLATVAQHLVVNRFFVRWYLEPLVVLVPLLPLALAFAWWRGEGWALAGWTLATLGFPCLLNYLVLRALGLRDSW